MKRLKHGFLIKIFLSSLIPWTIILISSLGLYRMMIVRYEEEIYKRYEQMSQSITAELNLIFSGVAHTGYVITNSPAYTSITNNTPIDDIFETTMGDLLKLRNQFSDTAIINDIIDSLFLYLPESNVVLYSMGTETADLFFSSTNRMEDYPIGFWKSYIPPSYTYALLRPTLKKGNTPQQRWVIPIIVPSRNLETYIVMLIRENFIRQVLASHRITPNTRFTLIGADGRRMVDTSDQFLPDTIDSTESRLGWKRLEVAFYLGEDIFTLVTSFPMSDVIELTSNLRLIMIVSMALLAILSSIVSFLLSRNISKPVETLIELMRKRSVQVSSETGELKYLQQGVENLLTTSENLDRNLRDLKPIVVENTMEQLLLDRRTVNPWLTMKKLKEFGLEFPSNCFQVVLVKMDPSDETFIKLTQDDISLFYAGAFDMITAGLPEQFGSWQVGFEDHTMRILLNLPLGASSSEVVEGFIEFIEIFKKDSHLHNVSIGLGEVHSGVEHIHTSYNEARIALERVIKDRPNSVLVYNNEKLKQDFVLPEQDSNKFYDNLLLGKMAPTLAHLDEIVLANTGAAKSKEAMKKLIFQIYLLVQQVCQTKMISESKLMGVEQVQLALLYNSLSFDEMAGYIRKLIPAVSHAILPNSPQKIEKTDLEDYLEENFCRDISLDDLADRYKTTPAYVSKCIKNLLGVPLMGYLAEKRIAFAVYLLTETKELSIEEIASICGYPNRIHFTRVFKERRGMPPTEYRKHVALEKQI